MPKIFKAINKIFAITSSLASNYNTCVSAVLVDQLSSYSCICHSGVIWDSFGVRNSKCPFLQWGLPYQWREFSFFISLIDITMITMLHHTHWVWREPIHFKLSIIGAAYFNTICRRFLYLLQPFRRHLSISAIVVKAPPQSLHHRRSIYWYASCHRPFSINMAIFG